MYKNIKIFSLLTVLFLSVISCSGNAQAQEKSTQHDVLSISYHRTAGRGGSENILATKDSLITNASGRMAQDIKVLKKKINPVDWQKLVSAINVKTLDKMVSGEGRGHYDGPDMSFEIVTKEKTYKLLNVQDSVHVKQLTTLQTLLKEIVSKSK